MAYTPEEIAQIKAAYHTTDGKLNLGVELLREQLCASISRTTVSKYWAEESYKGTHGGKRPSNGRGLTQEQIDLAIRRLPMYGTVAKTAKALGHSEETLRKHLRKRGITSKGLEKLL